ncbi:7243_t:CDS:2 [Dentiscutata erythropus]|uniref:7243_t:CDS:1 n=1 Tax=Dentiscutata erythropus TaxID=1348616 RepID=A0A9N9FUT0_9GLOM|nr:7243_t:CDS:2 [Dentiscutata erythropus]
MQLLESANKELEDSTNNDIKSANIDFYFEEFDKKFLQISVEEVNIEANNENGLAMNNFFNANTFKQNQIKISEENLATYSQRSINSIEDWSINDIFFQF